MKDIVAVVNSNEDVVEAISLALAEEGMAIVTGHVPSFKRGHTDVMQFFKKEKPRVVVWDISPPYLENWKYFLLVRSNPACAGVRFVLTTTNKRELGRIAKDVDETIEIVGKPEDIASIATSVKKALQN